MIYLDEKSTYIIEDSLGSKARVKILKELAFNDELSISQVIKKTRLNHALAKGHLDYLIAIDLVQAKSFGRIKIYRFKIENTKAYAFKKFLQIWEKS